MHPTDDCSPGLPPTERAIPEWLYGKVRRVGGCWIWAGHLARDGYGRMRGRLAHRVVYEVLEGAVPADLELDHLCRVVACVNPDHLEPVTRLENMRRRYELYTHCKSGHEFTPENTYVMPNGHRSCRTCRNAASNRYKSRKRGDA